MNSHPRISFSATKASVLLDLIRAVAALLVGLEHWRNLVFVDYPQISTHRIFFLVPYVICGAGHEAVVIFFVLSGYLIGGSIFRLLRRNEWDWKLYLTHRLARLWIVLVPALLLGAMFDFAGLHFYLAPALYAGQTGTHMMANLFETFHVRAFFGNLFFVQGILTSIFGSNTPLWSLANEFWYYILFPCGLLALRKGSSRRVRIVNAIAFILCAVFVGRAILLMFPLWLLGALLAALSVPRTRVWHRFLAAILYCALFFSLTKQKLITGMLSDYVIAFATVLFLWLLLSAEDAAPQSKWVNLSRTGARFSYTLYLVHVPFLVFVTALVGAGTRLQPTALGHQIYGFAVLASTIIYAYAVARATEFHTDKVRGWVEKKVLGKAANKKESIEARA
jgi:peptidoglycan/LPS O-acetylase OafA/YrhL